MASHSHIQSHLNSLIWMLDECKTPFVTLKLKFLCKNMDIHVILPSMKKLPSTKGALLRGLKSKQASCFHDLYRSRSDCIEEAVFLNLVYLHLASTCKHCFLFSFLLFEILRNSKNIARIANAVQVTVCLLVSTNLNLNRSLYSHYSHCSQCLLVSTSVY